MGVEVTAKDVSEAVLEEVRNTFKTLLKKGYCEHAAIACLSVRYRRGISMTQNSKGIYINLL